MSVEGISELNRRQIHDFTKDEHINMIAENQAHNLFIENFKFNREKSPSTCHNNADTINETVDISRINTDKKNESNHTNQQSDTSSKRQKSLCYDFKKGICRRRFCRVSKHT